MPANERRIIHLALAEHQDVITESVGQGESRRVVILPKED
jgi:spoIIIJ-associated protein